jgi:hypothetical protein
LIPLVEKRVSPQNAPPAFPEVLRRLQLARLNMLVAAMKDRIGWLQRAVLRELVIRNGEPATTADFLRRAFPRMRRFEPWRYEDTRRAAKKFAVRVGRAGSKGRPVTWMPNADLQKRIDT